MISKICDIFSFLCQVQMDFSNEAVPRSSTFGAVIGFEQCKRFCNDIDAQLINKEYFEYLPTV